MSFNLEPFWEVELATQIHVVFALLALFLGSYIFTRRKGTRLHKALGKAWVAFMVIVALSSFFIHGLKTWGLFSPLHLLSIFTLASLTYSVWAIRTGRIDAHRLSLIGLFIGGLVITGILTLAQGLLMHKIFFSNGAGSNIPYMSDLPGGIIGFVFAMVAVVFVGVFLLGEWQRRKSLAGNNQKQL